MVPPACRRWNLLRPWQRADAGGSCGARLRGQVRRVQLKRLHAAATCGPAGSRCIPAAQRAGSSGPGPPASTLAAMARAQLLLLLLACCRAGGSAAALGNALCAGGGRCERRAWSLVEGRWGRGLHMMRGPPRPAATTEWSPPHLPPVAGPRCSSSGLAPSAAATCHGIRLVRCRAVMGWTGTGLESHYYSNTGLRRSQ